MTKRLPPVLGDQEGIGRFNAPGLSRVYPPVKPLVLSGIRQPAAIRSSSKRLLFRVKNRRRDLHRRRQKVSSGYDRFPPRQRRAPPQRRRQTQLHQRQRYQRPVQLDQRRPRFMRIFRPLAE